MAAESNFGFHYEDVNSALNRHGISFQSGMVSMGSYFGLNNGTSEMMYSGNSSMFNTFMSEVDSVPGLKHEAGLAVEWSVDEQYKLEEGLAKCANEPSIMKYIKIAATLRDKTVRDVALRCRWINRKRRKQEHNLVKKVNSRKDKPVESSLKPYLQSSLPPSMSTYALPSHQMNESHCIQYDGLCGPLKQLLEQNAQAFSQINANLSTYKLQDNINLFSHARQNICTILNNMIEMPGIMSRMPPLPLSINVELARSILPTELRNSS